MREIKFRAYDKEDKQLFDNPWYFKKELLNKVFLDENYIFMQYTGRKASNYIDIYEGDIVRHLNGMIYEVCFDEALNGFDFREQLNEDGIEIENKDYLNCGSEFALEVIGNIYENHELLETI